LLETGRFEEALVVATQCIERNLNDPFFLSADAPLIRAEALHALGRTTEAREAINGARQFVLDTAGALPEADRGSYLGSVRSSARALALATEWA
jgi:hypothetical protein